MQPTQEQAAAIDLFKTGGSLAIEAGAGTGKTSTLVMVAKAAGNRNGQYVAFNKALVEESRSKFPLTVACNTAHSLAFRAIGRNYSHRLNSSMRMQGRDIAVRLGISQIEVQTFDGKPKTLYPGFLASLANKTVTNFCQSAAESINERHAPWQAGLSTESTYLLAQTLVPYARAMWADLQGLNGWVPYKHEHYLKTWQLSDPRISADYILFDESQDANPVIAAIIAAQAGHAQLVYVGDSCQPAGTSVRVVTAPGWTSEQPTKTELRPIEKIKKGDKVVSYSMPGSHLFAQGKEVLGVSSRKFKGKLVSVETTDGHLSSYTPDHRCVARLSEGYYGKHVVYLMRKGASFRVGRATGRYETQRGASGPMLRALQEKADALWILSTHPTAEDAAREEALVSHLFQLPMMLFQAAKTRALASQPSIDQFWAQVGDLTDLARRCLQAHSKLLELPLWQRGEKRLLMSRATVVRACNLETGMLLPVVIDGQVEWQAITVGRCPYDGQVYSMTVDETHTYVGDGIVTHNCQEIYAWTGAVNALAQVKVEHRAFLTQSFRFGQAIADKANEVLDLLEADIRLSGNPAINSRVEPLDQPKAILARTNAVGVTHLLGLQAAGRTAHFVGGAGELLSFARGAQELMDTGHTSHPDLVCFDSWSAVQAYVQQDEGGEDLRLLVRLMDNFGSAAIVAGLERMPNEDRAEVVISTAHKSKGREWSSVQLASDFPQRADSSKADLRLLYVAMTRAKEILDDSTLLESSVSLVLVEDNKLVH
jgi:hypothetical protein